MREDEVHYSINPCVNFFPVDVVLVALSVGDSGRVLLLGIAYESFQPEVFLSYSRIYPSDFMMYAMRSRKLRTNLQWRLWSITYSY